MGLVVKHIRAFVVDIVERALTAGFWRSRMEENCKKGGLL